MTGLEKIIAEIKDEAAVEAEKAIESATNEAKKIVEAAKAESAQVVSRIETAASSDVSDMEKNREGAIALQRRQHILATKQELLAETLQKARDSLYDLPQDAYFDLIVRLVAVTAHTGQGELMLSEADKKRLPKDFEKKVKAAVAKDVQLTVSDATRPIDGGFVLKYGDVEENCSFAAIFDTRADEFADLIRDTLFA